MAGRVQAIPKQSGALQYKQIKIWHVGAHQENVARVRQN